MQDLFETTHRGVHLAIREKDQVVFVERFLSPETATDRTRVGGRYELHATAIGLVLLAYAPHRAAGGDRHRPAHRAELASARSPSASCGRSSPTSGAPGYATSVVRNEYSRWPPPSTAHRQVVAALSLILPISESYGPSLAHSSPPRVAFPVRWVPPQGRIRRMPSDMRKGG